jgi:GT2 family glycosyltransferase
VGFDSRRDHRDVPDKHPRLAAVVLNFETYEATLDCVTRLASSPDVARVYVVDNASRDGSGDRLAQHFASGRPSGRSDVVVIQRDHNGGYGAGNNAGLQAALDAGFTAALVLNPDVQIAAGSIAHMLPLLRPPVAVVATVLWNDAGHTELECFGGAFYSRLTSRSHPARTAMDAAHADFFSGACFLVELAALEAAGWLAEHYFLYYEELDLVRRLAATGRTWTVAGASSAVHQRGSSVGSSSDISKQSLLSSYYGTRSAIVYTLTWERGYAVPVTLCRAARAVRIGTKSRKHASAILSAIASAWRSPTAAPGSAWSIRDPEGGRPEALLPSSDDPPQR